MPLHLRLPHDAGQLRSGAVQTMLGGVSSGLREAHIMTAQLTTADVASLLGVTPATVRSYSARGYLPKPDGHLGRTPWWTPETITEWQKTRPGQGVGGGRPRKAEKAPSQPEG